MPRDAGRALVGVLGKRWGSCAMLSQRCPGEAMGLSLIEAFDHEHGWLLQGRCVATLDEVARVFVESAPNPEVRGRLFNALVAWIDSVHAVVQTDRIWVDGGFLTHKQSPPSDIDVVAFVKPDLLTEEANAALDLLRTRDENGRRIQPMGGRIDGFIDPAGTTQKFYWVGEWARVRHPVTRETWIGKTKGFVEVAW